MKKILLLAAVALVAFACQKGNDEPTPPVDETAGNLTIRLSGVQSSGSKKSRATEAAGEADQLTLVDGHIFVIDALGEVAHDEALVPADADVDNGGTGQELSVAVPSDSRIYILGNIPNDVDVNTFSTLDDILEAVSTITKTRNNDYTKAALANTTGDAEAITRVGATNDYVAEVDLSPLYSRLELHKITGKTSIVSFDVKGVYVDKYYPQFTLAGAGTGDQWNQATNTVFAGNIGDAGTWQADTKVAAPTEGVWAYHVGPAGRPMVIVHLQNVVYNDGEEDVEYLEGADCYLTVTNYTGFTGTFKRGMIYTIEDLQFDETNLGGTPNPANVSCVVKVTVTDWDFQTLTPEL